MPNGLSCIRETSNDSIEILKILYEEAKEAPDYITRKHLKCILKPIKQNCTIQ